MDWWAGKQLLLPVQPCEVGRGASVEVSFPEGGALGAALLLPGLRASGAEQLSTRSCCSLTFGSPKKKPRSVAGLEVFMDCAFRARLLLRSFFSSPVVQVRCGIISPDAPVHLDRAGVIRRVCDALLRTFELPLVRRHDAVDGAFFGFAHVRVAFGQIWETALDSTAIKAAGPANTPRRRYETPALECHSALTSRR